MSERRFTAEKAVRHHVPVWLGLYGPSGSGKTFSALRLATGIAKVAGGDVFVIDTEAGRSLTYADRFRFRHVPLAAPFASTDYLAAVKYCCALAANGDAAGRRDTPATVVIDSFSHEHEGEGGYLKTQEAESDRLSKGDEGARGRIAVLSWAKPARLRQEMINGLLQQRANLVCCFRAKEKIKPGKDDKGRSVMIDLGWMPIAGPNLLYEMTANMLLLPNANGVPCWQSVHDGERSMMKLPEPFRDVLIRKEPLDEAVGQRIAEWARGDGAKLPALPIAAARDNLAMAAAKGMIALQAAWREVPNELKAELKKELDMHWKPIADKIDEASK